MAGSSSPPILEVEGVSKEYRSGEAPFRALDAVDLSIYPGEFLGITGKSGAGKTTLLNMISGVSHPTAGRIRYFGHANGNGRSQASPLEIHALSENELARWRGRSLGIVYQSFELMPSLTLVENVMLPPDFSGGYHPSGSREKAAELLDLVGIAEHAHKLPGQISGGQKQRVAIARALVNDPELIVADEPTGNLDTVTAETIMEIFERLAGQGKTIVMVTHDEGLAARFSRRLEITDGRLGRPGSNGNGKTQAGESEPAAGHVARAMTDATASPTRAPVAGDLEGRPPATSPGSAIELKGVTKVFESAAGRFTALDSIDLRLDYGQFISVVGKSGSGKSTLINMITGIDHPTAGEIVVGGRRIYDLSESERALWRGRNLGIVFQFFQLLPTLSLMENVMLPMDLCDVHPFSERPDRAMELLRRVGLEHQAHKLPASVSSGQQQEAAVARALATDPSIILADEPTGNLDSRSAAVILDLFEHLAGQGKTVIIVTHDPTITRRTDQTVILSDGEIIDPAVARALPFLSHPQMLAATRRAEKKSFGPGEVVLRQGEPVEHFFMVAEGEVEIVLAGAGAGEMRLARLGLGQFFGEIELRQGGGSRASVRAAPGGAALALLPKAEFARLVDESSLARTVLDEVAGQRLDENRRSRGGRR